MTCAKKTSHHSFPDPHVKSGTEDDLIEGYRNVRDEIGAWIDKTFGMTCS
jgi:hypothetical protein